MFVSIATCIFQCCWQIILHLVSAISQGFFFFTKLGGSLRQVKYTLLLRVLVEVQPLKMHCSVRQHAAEKSTDFFTVDCIPGYLWSVKVALHRVNVHRMPFIRHSVIAVQLLC